MLPVNCAQLARARNGRVAKTQRDWKSGGLALMTILPHRGRRRGLQALARKRLLQCGMYSSKALHCQEFFGAFGKKIASKPSLLGGKSFAGNDPGPLL